eukprot:TRINITY_DN2069_c0_g1_i4.p2 TRINITY_DN2069_c0_g1~~TRINITY_DN2069_c0_g1_i4.p2  ORF type:complete len:147 (+),score=33.57 TRINITY_DN2069_c0_g1_i4:443-883(+)
MVPDLLLSFTSPSPLRLDHLVHFSLYLLFFGAGTVAWHERERRLPSGTAHTVLGFVFLLEALILVSHRFNSDLERLAHQLLAGLAAGTGLSLLGEAVSYTHLRAHETPEHLVCRLLLEKKKKKKIKTIGILKEVFIKYHQREKNYT